MSLLNIKDKKKIEQSFGVKYQYGKSLPNPKSVSDGTPFYLLSSDGVYEECLMFKGKWCRKIADSNSRIVLEEI